MKATNKVKFMKLFLIIAFVVSISVELYSQNIGIDISPEFKKLKDRDDQFGINFGLNINHQGGRLDGFVNSNLLNTGLFYNNNIFNIKFCMLDIEVLAFSSDKCQALWNNSNIGGLYGDYFHFLSLRLLNIDQTDYFKNYDEWLALSGAYGYLITSNDIIYLLFPQLSLKFSSVKPGNWMKNELKENADMWFHGFESNFKLSIGCRTDYFSFNLLNEVKSFLNSTNNFFVWKYGCDLTVPFVKSKNILHDDCALKLSISEECIFFNEIKYNSKIIDLAFIYQFSIY